MIFQGILSVSMLFIVVYAFNQKNKSPFISLVTMLCVCAGQFFIWSPDHATLIAHSIGVGRGADLILYCWVVISTVLLLNLHFKIRGNLDLITILVRKVAIMEAEKEN